MIGWLLQTKALIMIIFANVLLDKDDHHQRDLHRAAADGGGSTMLTVPVVSPMLLRIRNLVSQSVETRIRRLPKRLLPDKLREPEASRGAAPIAPPFP